MFLWIFLLEMRLIWKRKIIILKLLQPIDHKLGNNILGGIAKGDQAKLANKLWLLNLRNNSNISFIHTRNFLRVIPHFYNKVLNRDTFDFLRIIPYLYNKVPNRGTPTIFLYSWWWRILSLWTSNERKWDCRRACFSR